MIPSLNMLGRRLEKSLRAAAAFLLLMTAFSWDSWASWMSSKIECPYLNAAVKPLGACVLSRTACIGTGHASRSEEQLIRELKRDAKSWNGRLLIFAMTATLMSVFASWIWQLIAFLDVLLSRPPCAVSGWIPATLVLGWALWNATEVIPWLRLPWYWYRGDFARDFAARMALYDQTFDDHQE
jgi:hypothetical protein